MCVANADSFGTSVLNSLPQQIAVIDADGVLQWVNLAWKAFSEENGGCPDRTWRGTNYLSVCSRSAETGDALGQEALAGIEAVVREQQPIFYLEYPCHSPSEQRWFMMCVRPIDWDGPNYYVVTHQNITERKLKELLIHEIALHDSVTGIATRRRFDDFLADEWQRTRRLGHPLSMALLDVDGFKPYNDRHGHLAGDDCLRRIGETLKANCRRPGDLAARYGGDEFGLIFGNTPEDAAYALADRIREGVEALGIAQENGSPDLSVTVSVGIATFCPASDQAISPIDLVAAADLALYQAKASGRNRVCVQSGSLADQDAASKPAQKRASG